MFDEERWGIRREARGGGEPPADRPAVGPDALTRHRLGQVRASGPKSRDIALDRVGGDGPRRETTACREGADGRGTHPRAPGQGLVEHPDELEVGVSEPDQSVVRAEPVVAAAAACGQSEGRGQLGCRDVRIGNGDDQVVDAQIHAGSVAAGRAG